MTRLIFVGKAGKLGGSFLGKLGGGMQCVRLTKFLQVFLLLTRKNLHPKNNACQLTRTI